MLEANRGEQARMGKTESFVKPNGGTVRTIPDDRDHLPEAERGAVPDQAPKQ
jgi:hypothetical protein